MNVHSTVEQVGQQNVIMAFVDDAQDDVDRDAYLETIRISLQTINNIEDIELVLREDGFQSIKEELADNASILSNADASFLPDGFRITVQDMKHFEMTVAQISELPQVIHIRQNSDLAGRLQKSVKASLTSALVLLPCFSWLPFSSLPIQSALQCIHAGLKSAL